MFIEVIIIAILVGLIMGGKIANLGRINFKYFYLIIAAYVIQAGVDYWANGHLFGGSPYLHLVSYLILFFVLWQNRQLPGMYLIIIGTLLNFIVIALNGGQMPVNPTMLPSELSQALAAGHGGTHGLITGNTRVKFLADIFHIAYFNRNQLISIGDTIMDVGVFLLVIIGMKKTQNI